MRAIAWQVCGFSQIIRIRIPCPAYKRARILDQGLQVGNHRLENPFRFHGISSALAQCQTFQCFHFRRVSTPIKMLAPSIGFFARLSFSLKRSHKLLNIGTAKLFLSGISTMNRAPGYNGAHCSITGRMGLRYS